MTSLERVKQQQESGFWVPQDSHSSDKDSGSTKKLKAEQIQQSKHKNGDHPPSPDGPQTEVQLIPLSAVTPPAASYGLSLPTTNSNSSKAPDKKHPNNINITNNNSSMDNSNNNSDSAQKPEIYTSNSNTRAKRDEASRRKKQTYCICKSNDDSMLVACDICDNWFHPKCVNLSKQQAESMEYYVCPYCRPFIPEEFKLVEERYKRKKKAFCGEIRNDSNQAETGFTPGFEKMKRLGIVCTELLEGKALFSTLQQQQYASSKQPLVDDSSVATTETIETIIPVDTSGAGGDIREVRFIPVSLLTENCVVQVIPNLLPLEQSSKLLTHCVASVPWIRENTYGTSFPEAHLSSWFGDPICTYSYLNFDRKTNKWSNELLEAKSAIERVANATFDSACLFQLKNGADFIPIQSEKRPCLGDQPMIAVFILGSPRNFQLQSVERDETKIIHLDHGSLLLMYHNTWKYYLHSITKETPQSDLQTTVIMTFRFIQKNRQHREHKGKKIGYGHPSDIPVHSCFVKRIELWENGLHSKQSGAISGSASKGVESILFAQMCSTDRDDGSEIIYTASGKHLTGPKTTAQEMKRSMLALKKNLEDKTPVRVIRSSKLSSKFAPTSGFRYDGIYYVTQSWTELDHGVDVVRFKLKVEGPAPPERELGGHNNNNNY